MGDLSAGRFNPLPARTLMELGCSLASPRGRIQGTPGCVWGDGGGGGASELCWEETAERPKQPSFLPVNQPKANGRQRKVFPEKD